MDKCWKLYILRCRGGSLYTGVTTDVPARLEAHRAGKGAKYTRGRGPLELVYQEECGSHSAALKRELKIKALTRAQKEKLIMDRFSIHDMRNMQVQLQEKYKDKWEPIGTETGQNKLLWMVGEIGEVADIIKKNGAQCALEDPQLRSSLVEELADVLMYYNDVLLCYGISEEELKQAYERKFERNMSRW